MPTIKAYKSTERVPMTRKTNTFEATFVSFRALRTAFLCSLFVLVATYNLSAQICTNCPTCPRNGARDTVKPLARCRPTLTVSLDQTGFRAISPLEIDNFSIDNCPIIWLWADHTCFICSDAGKIVPVTLFVEDTAGNRSTCRTLVTVLDNTPPSIRNCPTSVSAVASGGACGKAITFPAPTIVDNCTSTRNVTLTQTSGLASGSTFPIGVTTNTYVGRDSVGNTNTCSFKVTVTEQVVQVGNGSLPCTTQAKVTLNNNCEATVTPQMLLSGTDNVHCLTDYKVTIKYGTTQLANNVVNGTHLNRNMQATLTSTRTGVACTANLEVLDNAAPIVQAPAATLVTCSQLNSTGVPDPSVSGEPRVMTECSGSTNKFFVDTLFDATCGNTFTTRPANFPTTATLDTARGRVSTRIISRTFSVVDPFGNTTKSNQIIYIQKPDIQLVTINPTVNLWCGSAPNTSPDTVTINGVKIAGTGRPNYSNGLTGTACQFNSTFTDRRETLANSYRIIRTWTVRLSCGAETRTLEQTINVTDERPLISCKSNERFPFQVSTKMAEVTAKSLTASFSDDCTPLSNLTVTMRKVGSTTAFPIDEKLVFACGDTGTYPIEVWIKDASGQTNYCTTSIRVSDDNGVCPIIKRPSLTGTIETETGLPILAKVNLTGSNTDARYSENGQYQFLNILRGGNFNITPERDTDWVNGVSTADINALSKVILGSATFNSPYKYIAADVNRDSFIDAVDMLLMRRLVLLFIPKVEGNTSWRFVTKDFVFPSTRDPLMVSFPTQIQPANVTDSLSSLNFIAIKTADLNNTVRNAVGDPTIEPRGSNPLIINTKDEILEVGKTYEITLSKPKTDISGFQFTLNYDKSKIQFHSIKPLDLRNFDESNYALFPEHGKITMSWNHHSSGSIAEPMNMLSLHLTVRQPTRLSEVLRLTSDMTPAEAYDAAGVVQKVKLDFTNTRTNGNDFALLNAEPNPVAGRSTTTIPFRLPEATDVKLTLMDETGRILSTQTRAFAKGENTWRIETPSVSGVVLYRMDTPTHSATRRLVIIR
jgi:HYR domain/Cohesin domain